MDGLTPLVAYNREDDRRNQILKVQNFRERYYPSKIARFLLSLEFLCSTDQTAARMTGDRVQS